MSHRSNSLLSPTIGAQLTYHLWYQGMYSRWNRSFSMDCIYIPTPETRYWVNNIGSKSGSESKHYSAKHHFQCQLLISFVYRLCQLLINLNSTMLLLIKAHFSAIRFSENNSDSNHQQVIELFTANQLHGCSSLFGKLLPSLQYIKVWFGWKRWGHRW